MNSAVKAIKTVFRKDQTVNWEALGYRTRLECQNVDGAREICACAIQSEIDRQRPVLKRLQIEVQQEEHKAAALRAFLYDRTVPANDAEMLALDVRRRILLALIAITGMACLAGSTITLYLFGLEAPAIVLGALGITSIPVAVGHFFYEQVLSRHKTLQTLFIVASVAICFLGLFELGQARRHIVRRATASTVQAPFVDGAATDLPAVPDPTTSENSEAAIREGLSDASFLIMFAAEFVLGFLVARYTQLCENVDYVAWHALGLTVVHISELEHAIAEILASLEIAKKQCSAGILRGENELQRRRPPTYYGPPVAVIAIFTLLAVSPSRAQQIEHYDAILIDTSKSIARGESNELFHEYLSSARRLLQNEPPNSRVLVAVINKDSFGTSKDLVKGWTPDARGIFTDNLIRARHDLSAIFEAKTADLSPIASSTDIFGALWHVKTFFDSFPDAKNSASNAIWIFSDMMNETPEFSMPELIALGPDEMLSRAQAKRLLVPLKRYKIHVQGAASDGLTPQRWITMKEFWGRYFSSAGAEVITYSPECLEH